MILLVLWLLGLATSYTVGGFEVYIDYSGDGYYLYNRRHPRDRIAISVYVD